MAKRESEWFGWVKAFVIAFALVFIIRTFFFSPIVVDGPSMLPTLEDRDQMIVNKINYRMSDPERFDIVVFHASEQKDFIKRIIGLPDEHVSFQNDELYIDGQKIEEIFLNESKKNLASSQVLTRDFKLEDLTGEHEVIPKGHVLVLGDNRKNSTDSRNYELGLISIDDIVGKASIIYWPPSRISIIKN